MKLTQLEYFCVAARYHNITKAAKELFVTQPSISNAIKALEEEFGVNLFFRNNNKLTLTPEGELFYKSAEGLLAHADSVETEFHELRKKITPIRIGIPPMLGTIYLPELYLSLKENFPEVDFRLFEFGSVKACELVLEEKLDIAIVNAEQPAIDKCNSRIIDTEDLYFCVAPDHPLAEQKTILLTMLANEPLILFNTDSVQVMTLTRQFKAVGVTPHVIQPDHHSHQYGQIRSRRNLPVSFYCRSTSRSHRDPGHAVHRAAHRCHLEKRQAPEYHR